MSIDQTAAAHITWHTQILSSGRRAVFIRLPFFFLVPDLFHPPSVEARAEFDRQLTWPYGSLLFNCGKTNSFSHGLDYIYTGRTGIDIFIYIYIQKRLFFSRSPDGYYRLMDWQTQYASIAAWSAAILLLFSVVVHRSITYRTPFSIPVRIAILVFYLSKDVA